MYFRSFFPKGFDQVLRLPLASPLFVKIEVSVSSSRLPPPKNRKHFYISQRMASRVD